MAAPTLGGAALLAAGSSYRVIVGQVRRAFRDVAMPGTMSVLRRLGQSRGRTIRIMGQMRAADADNLLKAFVAVETRMLVAGDLVVDAGTFAESIVDRVEPVGPMHTSSTGEVLQDYLIEISQLVGT